MAEGKGERKAARGDAALPRELLVMRHGKSDWGDEAKKDFDRPLAKRGRKDAPRVGRWMRKAKVRPDLVVSSPARRAKETVHLLLEEIGYDEDQVRWEPRLYESTMEKHLLVLSEIPRSAGRVLLVGHNPALEDLVLHLGGDAIRIPEDGKVLPTAAVARFRMPADWGRLPPGAGDLASLVRPKELKEE